MIFKNQKIRPEEFPDQKDFMPKILDPINFLFSSLSQVLNKNVTFKENIAADILPVVIDGTFPLDIRWTLKTMPVAAWIGKCYESSGQHVTIANGVFLDWEMKSNSLLRINNITGITPSPTNIYNVTIVAITG